MNQQPFAEITALLASYFDGLYHGDTARLARVFHPRARYVTAVEGGPLDLGLEEYLPIVERRPSPASRGEPRRDRIVSIELAGPVTALARVECAIGPRRFTDFLSLVRVEGQWRIIAKVFHYDVEEEPVASGPAP